MNVGNASHGLSPYKYSIKVAQSISKFLKFVGEFFFKLAQIIYTKRIVIYILKRHYYTIEELHPYVFFKIKKKLQ